MHSVVAMCTGGEASVMQPDELNLLEDGLQLWLIALRNAPAPHAALLDLFSNLAAVMERSTGATISWCSLLLAIQCHIYTMHLLLYLYHCLVAPVHPAILQ